MCIDAIITLLFMYVLIQAKINRISLISGCFCPSGTAELGDKCISPEECPSTNTTVVPGEEVCPMGMVYDECGTACPTTCDNKDEPVRPCTLQCVQGKIRRFRSK